MSIQVLDASGSLQDQWELLEGGASLKDLVADFERTLIHSALEKTEGNQKKAAHLLRLKATTLNEKLKRLHIRPTRSREE